MMKKTGRKLSVRETANGRVTSKTLANTCSAMQGAMPEGDITNEQETLASLAKLSGAAYRQLRALEDAVYAPDKPAEAAALADYSVNTLIPAMFSVR